MANGGVVLDGGDLSHVHAEIRRLDELRTGSERLFEEKVKRLDERIDGQDAATTTALAAAEKAVAAALAASDKGVAKAEVAQAKVNEGQNEFRGALKDQAATLMPRAEAEGVFREIRALIAAQSTQVADLRSRIDIGPPSLGALQAQASGDLGRRSGSLETRSLIFAIIGAIGLFAGLALALAR